MGRSCAKPTAAANGRADKPPVLTFHTLNQPRKEPLVDTSSSTNRPARVASKAKNTELSLAFLVLVGDDVELLAHVDTVEELTDILPLDRRRLLDARGCVANIYESTTTQQWQG